MGYDRFELLAHELGYDPKDVIAFRFLPKQIYVVFKRHDGMPASNTHEVVR